MEARVKATGEIVEVRGIYTPTIRTFGMEEIESYDMEAVEIVTDPDYWTRLEHTYAGMAMQSYVSNNVYLREIREMCKEPQEMRDFIADLSILLATTLIQKLKEKEE